MIVPTKPSVKMKTVTKQIEHCLEVNCKGCYLKDQEHCIEFLMMDTLWYLKQTLEKSERRNNVSEIYRSTCTKDR